MAEINRRVPPPPPPRNIPQTPSPVQMEVKQENQVAQQKPPKREMSVKTKFGLLIAGGVLSLAISAAMIILIFVL